MVCFPSSPHVTATKPQQMAVSANWGGVLIVGVLIERALNFGVQARPPDSWKLVPELKLNMHIGFSVKRIFECRD